MRHVTIVCDMIATDEFNEKDIKAMLDSSPHVREVHMQVKIEQIKGGDINPPKTKKRW